ncbi:hypothetical protein C1H46_018877 [Malus baccata]|uniref:Uncharacterized protein n=1 Tax=Malus baccata TaxID=106549 RepID=A0A540M9X7_MALBA|nr:hypothetical protein C1H46_018877 [Malus baccata]
MSQESTRSSSPPPWKAEGYTPKRGGRRLSEAPCCFSNKDRRPILWQDEEALKTVPDSRQCVSLDSRQADESLPAGKRENEVDDLVCGGAAACWLIRNILAVKIRS